MTDLEPALRQDLGTIAAHWPLMLDLPRAPGGERVVTTLGAPPPIPIGVLSLRRETTTRLAIWAHLIHTECRLAISIDLMNVPAVTCFIDIHAGWLAHHQQGPTAAAQISRLADLITEMVKQTQPRRVLIGHCPECSGRLIAIMRTNEPSEVRCDINGTHTWNQDQWRALNNRINGDTIRYEAAARRLLAILAKA